MLIDDPGWFDGARVIGVDEHLWRHTRLGDCAVTVIIDLTPVREKTFPSRLLDMVEGRSKAVFTSWLAACPQAWRDESRSSRWTDSLGSRPPPQKKSPARRR